jgi:uncharacterized membrane protein YbhN (UPF0104 family)
VNSKLKSVLQLLLSLALGFFLIWFVWKDLTAENKRTIAESFRNANYWWILLSMGFNLLGHFFRAYRWRYPLESLDIRISLPNRVAAVMIGYLANLAFPRLGEVARCAVLARYKKYAFEKLFGTVVAERMVDALVLAFIMGLTVLLQLDILGGFIQGIIGSKTGSSRAAVLVVAFGIAVAVVAFLGWRLLKGSSHAGAAFLRQKINGLMDGIKAVKRMQGQAWFYLHTAFIWISYLLMYGVALHAFPETAQVPIGGVLASFALGGLAIAAVQAGLGAYPLAVMAILTIYGVDKDLGYALGWIIWTAQAIGVMLAGFLSLLAMPLLNSRRV